MASSSFLVLGSLGYSWSFFFTVSYSYISFITFTTFRLQLLSHRYRLSSASFILCYYVLASFPVSTPSFFSHVATCEKLKVGVETGNLQHAKKVGSGD